MREHRVSKSKEKVVEGERGVTEGEDGRERHEGRRRAAGVVIYLLETIKATIKP